MCIRDRENWGIDERTAGELEADGTMAVVRRVLGRRLVDAIRVNGGMESAAAAQGVRRFWKRTEEDVAMK